MPWFSEIGYSHTLILSIANVHATHKETSPGQAVACEGHEKTARIAWVRGLNIIVMPNFVKLAVLDINSQSGKHRICRTRIAVYRYMPSSVNDNRWKSCVLRPIEFRMRPQ